MKPKTDISVHRERWIAEAAADFNAVHAASRTAERDRRIATLFLKRVAPHLTQIEMAVETEALVASAREARNILERQRASRRTVPTANGVKAKQARKWAAGLVASNQAVYDYLKGKVANRSEISDALEIGERTAQRALTLLVQRKLVERYSTKGYIRLNAPPVTPKA